MATFYIIYLIICATFYLANDVMKLLNLLAALHAQLIQLGPLYGHQAIADLNFKVLIS
jgi:hypothetical protein